MNNSNELRNDRDEMSNETKSTIGKVRRLFSNASHEIQGASTKVKSEIRSHPTRSSAIALGVGVLLGALLTSSRTKSCE